MDELLWGGGHPWILITERDTLLAGCANFVTLPLGNENNILF